MLQNSELEANAILPVKPANSYYSCSLQEPVKLRINRERHIQTIPQFFHKCCEKFKNKPALAYECLEEPNKWCTITYGEYEKNVEQAALVLLHLGVKPRTSVAILAFNCPEWFYVEMAAFRIGAVAVGVYTSNSAEAVHYILESSDATVCLVDDGQQMLKVRAVKSRLNQLRAVVQLNGPFADFIGKEEGYYCWSELFGMQFDTTLREELLLRERDVAANECAVLIYTSGTVGMPKGVMLSHDSILYGVHETIQLLTTLHEQQQIRIVSYLPLNHVAAQFFDIFMAIEIGALVYFADRNALKGSLGKTFAKVKPTMMFAVPRIFEKFQEKFTQVAAQSSGITSMIMNTARNIMERHHLDKMANKPTYNFRCWLAAKIVHRIKVAMGLDQLAFSFVGGAPVTEYLKRFFISLDMPLIDVFGMSETSGTVTCGIDNPNLRTVGKPLPDVEVKIDNPNDEGQGEILLRAPNTLMGYLKDFNKTMETLTEDGWVRSGDLGYLDNDNHLYISGRLKELIITAGGENIPPVHIQHSIKQELPCISNVVIIGDQRKYLTALLTFKTEIDTVTGYPMDTLRSDTIQWLESLNLHYTKLSDLLNIKLPEDLQNFDPNSVDIKCDPKVLKAVQEGITRCNQQAISNAQKVQYFSLLPHDFSIATNELGLTLKVKNNTVFTKYAKYIEKMYDK